MNLISHLIQRQLGLDPPLTRDLLIERDLPVPMPDGTVLLADRWAPRTGGDKLPVALMRSPYGRGALITAGMVRPLAERGFQVILQSVRGTFGSGGAFEPMRNEREDGLATLEWLVKQPWFGDSIVLVGPSYLGYVQWAVADRLPPEVKAMIPQVTESALTLDFLRPDAYSLETPFGWGVMVAGQERRLGMLRTLLAEGKTRRAMSTLPLSEADVAAVGRRSGYIQDILRHDADDPYWAAIDHRDRVAETTVPVSSVGGWYDIFLPGQLRDFTVLQAGGADGAAHGRAVDAPVDGRGHDAGGPGVRARLRPRRRAAAARTGAAVRDGRGSVAGLRVLAAARLLAPPFYLGPDGALAAEQPGRLGARRLPLRPGRPDPGRRRRAHGPGRRRPGRQRRARGPAGRAHLHHRAARVRRRGDRRGQRADLVPLQPAAGRRVRPAVRRRSRRQVLEHLRRPRQPVGRRRGDRRDRPPVAHRLPVQRPATGSGSRFPAALSRGTRGTRAPASRAPPPIRLVPADQSVYHDPEHPSAITLPVRRPGRRGEVRSARSAGASRTGTRPRSGRTPSSPTGTAGRRRRAGS